MKIKKNEKGSTLLMIVITVTFLSVLGTALLSMNMMSVNMKHADKNFKNSHYYAESGIEQAYTLVAVQVQNTILEARDEIQKYLNDMTKELSALIEEIKEEHLYMDPGTTNSWLVDKASLETVNVSSEGKYSILYSIADEGSGVTLKKLYEQFLDEYLSVKGEALQEEIDETFEEVFNKVWKEKVTGKDGVLPLKQQIENYDYTLGTYQTTEDEREIQVTITEQMETQGLTLITVQSKYGYKGSDEWVQAEIKVVSPDLSYPIQIQEAISAENPIWESALVTQGDLIVNGKAKVEGNVYAFGKDNEAIAEKGGIIVQDSAILEIQDGNVLSRHYIQTRGLNSELIIKNANVYCNSLVIQEGAKDSKVSVEKSYLYTEDDIEHNGERSQMNITGRYIGFSSGLNATGSIGKHDTSSAIVINAKDIGQAGGSILTIDTQKDYFPQLPQAGATYDYAVTEGISGFFDKMSDKGILVPGTSWIISNAGDSKYQTGESVSVKNNYLVYSYQFPYTGKFDQDNLETEDIEGIPLTVTYKDGTALSVYDKDEYFNLFYNNQYKEDEEAVEIYPFFNAGKGIEIKPDHYWYTLGSRLGNESVNRATGAIDQADKLIEQINLDYKYILNNLVPRSNDSSSPEAGAAKVVEKYIDFEKVPASPELDTIDEVVRFYSGDITLNQSSLNGKTKGVIMSQGSITINGPFKFEGAIIAKGDIIINGNGVEISNFNSHTTTPDVEEATRIKLGKLINENSNFKQFFKESKEYKTQIQIEPSSGDAMAYQYTDLIEIANWKRVIQRVEEDEA